MRKNTFKGWIPTTGLALVLTFGVTAANAGMLVSDKPVRDQSAACKEGITVSDKAGITVSDRAGITVSDSPIAFVIDVIMGMLVSDKPMAQCTDNSKNGMLVSD